MGHPRSVESILSQAVATPGGCLEWTKCKTPDGYGQLQHRRQRWLAHRFAYVHRVGPIPDGLVIDHLCRNPACINVEHMEVVSNRINCLRGISPAAEQAR